MSAEKISIEPSEKLSTYMSKIIIETGRQIKIEVTDNSRLRNLLSAFQPHQPEIHVLINRKRLASYEQITDPDVERAIAHEITHGLLIYKQGYCYPNSERPISENEKNTVVRLFNMMDDIVVNKIILENGFSPFGSEYLPEVKKEIEAAHKGKDIYNQISNNPLIKNTHMVSRYIIAWGFLEYFDLEPKERSTIEEFIKSFQKSYPEQYEMATKIKDIVLQNDIFTPVGHRSTIEKILSLLGLEDLVELETD